MRSRTLLLALLVGCGGDEPTSTDLFQIDNIELTESVVNQVVVSGEITLLDGAGIGGADALATFYRDEYSAKIGTAQSVIGLDLTEVGESLAFELTTIQARLTPHEDGHLLVCVDLAIPDSNFAETTELGCLDGEPEQTTPTTTTPPPEEPPTVTINDPFELELFGLGETVDLDGRCTDPNQGNDTLDVEWTAELQGGTAGVFTLTTDPIQGNGDTRGEWVDPPLGDYLIVLTCTDDQGNEVSESRNISVVDRQLSDLDGDGFTPATGDCNDADATVNPGADEQCNNRDMDCSGEVDDKDSDGDGHVDEQCTAYTGVLPADDCADEDAAVYPGATETPGDGVDSDCDGLD